MRIATAGQTPKRYGHKLVIYGVEGIGKTTLASNLPGVLFLDVEGSCRRYKDIPVIQDVNTWDDVLRTLTEIRDNPGKYCQSLAVDTVDWLINAVTKHVIAIHGRFGINSIEDFGYGSGYKYQYEELARFLDLCTQIVETGTNVCLIAHAKVKSASLPESGQAFDRYELKLDRSSGQGCSAMIKEWADTLLFLNWDTVVYSTGKNSKAKASGGTERSMYSVHTASWDAKNRDGLPERMKLDYKNIAHLFGGQQQPLQVPEIQMVIPDDNPFVVEPVPAFVADHINKSRTYDTVLLTKAIYNFYPQFKGLSLAQIEPGYWNYLQSDPSEWDRLEKWLNDTGNTLPF